MNHTSLNVLSCALLLSFTACDQNDLPSEDKLSRESSRSIVKANVNPFEVSDAGDTRIDVSIIPTGAQFRWAKDDAIGIYAVSEADQQIKYTLEAGQGTSEAHFGSDGDFALEPNASYVAYYPYNSYGYSADQIAVNYSGQRQTGDASTSHLGNYDFMASSVSYATDPTEMGLNFRHLGCLVRLNLTVDGDDSFNSLVITGLNKGWALESMIDLTAEEPAVSPDGIKASFFEMQLSDITSTASDRNLTIYMMLPPEAYQGETWDLELKGGENSYFGKVSPVDQVAGRAYRYTAELKKPHQIEFVDMGLSVLWATTNLGAIQPEDRGSYYSWGETESKTVYTWDTYFEATPLKYRNGYDGLQTLRPEDDAATKLWTICRMPTDAEMKELIDNCKWEPQFDAETNAVVGYRVVTKSEVPGVKGNYIYLPVAGEAKSVGVEDPSQMKYWTSTLAGDDTRAKRLETVYNNNEVTAKIGTAYRYIGRTVRPVKER